MRVAAKYIDPEHLSILIVGDRAKIEGPLAATKIAPITVLGCEWRSRGDTDDALIVIDASVTIS